MTNTRTAQREREREREREKKRERQRGLSAVDDATLIANKTVSHTFSLHATSILPFALTSYLTLEPILLSFTDLQVGDSVFTLSLEVLLSGWLL
jgi:hypothetical protein